MEERRKGENKKKWDTIVHPLRNIHNIGILFWLTSFVPWVMSMIEKKNLSRPEWSTDSPTPSLSTSSSGSRGSRLPGTSSPKSERRPAIQLDRQSNVYVVASRLKICNVYRIKFNLQFKKVIILCYLHSVWYDNKFNISYLSLTIKHRKILHSLKSSACLACSVIQQAHDVHFKINLVKAVDEEAPFYTPDHFY